MQTQMSVPTAPNAFCLPGRCLACKHKTLFAVGEFRYCAACIVAENRTRRATFLIPEKNPSVSTACGYVVRISRKQGEGEFSTLGEYCGPNGWRQSSWNALGVNQTGLARLSLLLG